MSIRNIQSIRADELQHSGLGYSSEPFSNPKQQALYDAAAREYRAMLPSKGQTNDTSGRDLFGAPSRDFLLHQGSGRRYSSVRSFERLLSTGGDEGRAEGSIHSKQRTATGQEELGGGERRVDRGVARNYNLHALAATVAFALLGFIVFIGIIIDCALKLGGAR